MLPLVGRRRVTSLVLARHKDRYRLAIYSLIQMVVTEASRADGNVHGAVYRCRI